jgi:20S proteasome alpha/beta subunit
MEAINNAGSAVGILAKDGIVIAGMRASLCR